MKIIMPRAVYDELKQHGPLPDCVIPVDPIPEPPPMTAEELKQAWAELRERWSTLRVYPFRIWDIGR